MSQNPQMMIMISPDDLRSMIRDAVHDAVGSLPSEEAFVTSQQLADHIGVDVSTVTKRWARREGCPHVKHGREYRFKVSAVERWLEERERGAA